MVYVSSALGQYGTQLYRFDHRYRAWEVFQKHEAICCKKDRGMPEIGGLLNSIRRPYLRTSWVGAVKADECEEASTNHRARSISKQSRG